MDRRIPITSNNVDPQCPTPLQFSYLPRKSFLCDKVADYSPPPHTHLDTPSHLTFSPLFLLSFWISLQWNLCNIIHTMQSHRVIYCYVNRELSLIIDTSFVWCQLNHIPLFLPTLIPRSKLFPFQKTWCPLTLFLPCFPLPFPHAASIPPPLNVSRAAGVYEIPPWNTHVLQDTIQGIH